MPQYPNTLRQEMARTTFENMNPSETPMGQRIIQHFKLMYDDYESFPRTVETEFAKNPNAWKAPK